MKGILVCFIFLFSSIGWAEGGLTVDGGIQRVARMLMNLEGRSPMSPQTYNQAVRVLDALGDSPRIQRAERLVLQSTRAFLSSNGAAPTAERVIVRHGGAFYHLAELKNQLIERLQKPDAQRAASRGAAAPGTAVDANAHRKTTFNESVRNVLQAAHAPRNGHFSSGQALFRSRIQQAGNNGRPNIVNWRTAYQTAMAGKGGIRPSTNNRSGYPAQGISNSLRVFN